MKVPTSSSGILSIRLHISSRDVSVAPVTRSAVDAKCSLSSSGLAGGVVDSGVKFYE